MNRIFIFKRNWVLLGIVIALVSAIWNPLGILFLIYSAITLIGLIMDMHIEQRKEKKREEQEQKMKLDRYSDKKGSYHRHANKKPSL